jgi:acid phosphatase type 7
MVNVCNRYSGLLFVAILCTITIRAQVTRQPYLQVSTPESIVVRWQTGTGVIGKIFYGTSLASLNQNITESENEEIYHEVKIPGLKPGTKYYYSVDGSTKGNEDLYFITAPEKGSSTPVRIWVISDFGQTTTADNPRRFETINQWKIFNNNSLHSNFVLSLGDQTEDDAIYQIQHNYFSLLENVFKNSPLYTTIGNHDNHDSLVNYVRTYTIPSEAEAGGIPSHSKKYYSFNYSNIHVVVLCSEIYNDAEFKTQTEWLKKDLEGNRSGWLIACMHQPLHSGGYHPSDKVETAQKRRDSWLSLLEDHGVDVILQGHNHVYERSFLVDNLLGKSTTITDANKINSGLGRIDTDGPYNKPGGFQPHKGTVFLTVPGGGVANSAKYYPAPFSIYPVVFAGSEYEGSLVIDVIGNKLDVKFICDEKNEKGSHIWDYFTIIKTK